MANTGLREISLTDGNGSELTVDHNPGNICQKRGESITLPKDLYILNIMRILIQIVDKWNESSITHTNFSTGFIADGLPASER